MRALVTTFFFIVLFVGAGTVILGSPYSNNPNNSGDQSLIPASLFDNAQQSSGSLVVDRPDDDINVVLPENPCTDAAEDCMLRWAIDIANRDEKNSKITFATHFLIKISSPLPQISESGTTIYALPEQEVHIDGSDTGESVLQITADSTEINGLRIYGADADMHNIMITGTAKNVVIAHNIIGDDDGPAGNCGSSNFSYGGIYINSNGAVDKGARAWIFGNIIECHKGEPGDGITIVSGDVTIGKDKQDKSGPAQRNTIQDNKGRGVNLSDSTGNVVSNCDLNNNEGGPVSISNFNNDWVNNKIIEPSQ